MLRPRRMQIDENPDKTDENEQPSGQRSQTPQIHGGGVGEVAFVGYAQKDCRAAGASGKRQWTCTRNGKTGRRGWKKRRIPKGRAFIQKPTKNLAGRAAKKPSAIGGVTSVCLSSTLFATSIRRASCAGPLSQGAFANSTPLLSALANSYVRRGMQPKGTTIVRVHDFSSPVSLFPP